MTTSTPALAVLEGMYAAEADYLASGDPGTADFSTLAPFFAADAVLHQADSLPYGGIWRGRAGMERFFLAMSRTWSRFDLLDQRYLATAGPLVVHTLVRAESRVTGRSLDVPILQTVEVRAGEVTEVHPFYWDTAAIVEACRVP